MKPNNNNNSSKEGRSAARAISPSFRTGPRQRPSDASTDEIVRFVREYQRCKPPPPAHAISAMKTKAVLPSIERKRSDNVRHSHHQRISMSMEDEDTIRHSFESTKDMDVIDPRYATNGRTESTEDGLDSDGDFEHDKSELAHGNRSYGYFNHRADTIGRFRHKSKDSDTDGMQKRHSNYEISLDVERLLPRSNGVVSGNAAHTRHKRSSVHAQTTLYSHKHDLLTSPPMDQSFLQNTPLTRPTALRQLPPIINKDMQSSSVVPPRPSAPSPDKASPGLQSDGSDDSCSPEEDDENDVDGDEGYDDIDENEIDDDNCTNHVEYRDDDDDDANNDESNDNVHDNREDGSVGDYSDSDEDRIELIP